MDERAVWSTFTAKPDRKADVEKFLQACATGIAGEPGTSVFFALKLGDGRCTTFDTFADDDAYHAHLGGSTAHAVVDRAEDLVAADLTIVQGRVLAAKGED